MNNNVDPKHYKRYKYEPINVIEDWGLNKNYNLGNVIKYISRHEHKNGREDLEKALNYLHRELYGVWYQFKGVNENES